MNNAQPHDNSKNIENTKTVFGPPPEECIGNVIPLWKRVIIGSIMSAVMVVMLAVIIWILDRLTHQ